MHFVAMLAFSLPVPIQYDAPTTLASIGVAIVASLLGIALASRYRARRRMWVLGGGTLVGLGIAGMHYLGMAAMRMSAVTRYAPWLVALSVAIAVVAACAALRVAFSIADGRFSPTVAARLGPSLLLGGAISGMHYTGMWAATFLPADVPTAPAVWNLDPAVLGTAVGVAGLFLMALFLRADTLVREGVGVRRAEERFRRLLESAPDAVVICDGEGRIVLVNAQAERLTGYTRDELVGRTVERLVPDRYADGHRRHRAGYARQPRTRSMGSGLELALRRKDGRELPVEISLGPLETEEGLLISAAIRDVTERKQAEEALARSEAKYRDIVQNAAYGIARVSRDGRFLTVNPALVRMLGFDSAEELMEVDVARDVYADAEQWEEQWERLRSESRVDDAEIEWRKKDGTPIRVRMSARIVQAANGDSDVVETFVEDVTERRALEAQLRQSQKMEAVGQLTSGIAHDFNNVLSVILANAQLGPAFLGPGSEEVADVLEEIARAAQRGAEMVGQLLSLSRHADLRMRSVDLAHLVAGASPMLRLILPENVELRVSAEGPVHTVLADAGSVEQILLNLVNNARDAMPDGGVLHVDVDDARLDDAYRASHPCAGPGAYVCLSVSDSGVGMNEETQARIFEPFFTSKPRGVGTGLGLAMVYGLVRQHGGLVHVYSEPGRGTTFKLYFPVAETEAAVAEDDAPRAELRGGSETILLVEDDDALRSVGRRVLERYGYTVLTAADGLEALEVYRAERSGIDLVVSDSVMPGMGGVELYEALGGEGTAPRMLLMSGYREALARGGLAGAHPLPFLQKPWTIEDLLRGVRAVLDEE